MGYTLEPMDIGKSLWVNAINGNAMPQSTTDQLVTPEDDKARQVFDEHGTLPLFVLVADGNISIPVHMQTDPDAEAVEVGSAMVGTRAVMLMQMGEAARLFAVLERFRSTLNPFWTEQFKQWVHRHHHELAETPIVAMDMEAEAANLSPEMFTTTTTKDSE
jgi:hypothetical protein